MVGAFAPHQNSQMSKVRQLQADKGVIPKEKEIKSKMIGYQIMSYTLLPETANRVLIHGGTEIQLGTVGPNFEGQGFPKAGQAKITTRSWPGEGRGCQFVMGQGNYPRQGKICLKNSKILTWRSLETKRVAIKEETRGSLE